MVKNTFLNTSLFPQIMLYHDPTIKKSSVHRGAKEKPLSLSLSLSLSLVCVCVCLCVWAVCACICVHVRVCVQCVRMRMRCVSAMHVCVNLHIHDSDGRSGFVHILSCTYTQLDARESAGRSRFPSVSEFCLPLSRYSAARSGFPFLDRV